MEGRVTSTDQEAGGLPGLVHDPIPLGGRNERPASSRAGYDLGVASQGAPVPGPAGAPLDVEVLECTFDVVAAHGMELVHRFYARLFELAPSVRILFPDDMDEQKRVLLATLRLLRRSLRDLPALQPTLRQLGARHVQYGAQPEHYGLVARVLVDTLADLAGASWSADAAEQWGRALGAVAEEMLAGAGTVPAPRH